MKREINEEIENQIKTDYRKGDFACKKQEKELPVIEVDYNYHWRCPKCSEYQSIERDDDGFYPVIYKKCQTEFAEYKENF